MSTPSSDAGLLNTAKTRRSHRKSRNGCFECKRRHIRCDEAHPACTNCNIAERACAYPVKPKTSESQLRQQQIPPPTPPHPPPSLPPTSLGPPQPQQPAWQPPAHVFASSQQIFNPADSFAGRDKSYRPDSLPNHASEPPKQTLPSFSHLESRAYDPVTKANTNYLYTHEHLCLLHHVEHKMDGAIFAPNTSNVVISFALKTAAYAPFVLDQLLALAAAHQSHTAGASAIPITRKQATELQTRALAAYTKDTKGVTDDMYHCEERFLFISLLSLHVHHDNFRYHSNDYVTYIERFCSSMEFYRGMKLTSAQAYEYICTVSDLVPCMALTTKARAVMVKGTECDILKSSLLRLHPTSLHPDERVAIAEALEFLQTSFDIARAIEGLPMAQHPAASFSTNAPKDYCTMLRDLRPEALVVFAWHGVLLHRARTFWVYLNSGEWIIRATAQYLGGRFAELMSFPLRVVDIER